MADPAPWRMATCADLVTDCKRHGDRWARCLLAGAVGYAHARIGEDEKAGQLLRQAAEVASGLHAPVLEVWATAFALQSGLRSGNVVAPDEVGRYGRRAERLGAAAAARVLATASAGSLPASTGDTAPAGLPGEFRLSVAGGPVDWAALRPRSRALLMRLGMEHGRMVHRERLVDDLWPDATLVAGIRSLQVAASSVRQCLAVAGLPEGAVRREADAYALRLPGCVDQLRDFDRLSRQATRDEATGRTREALRFRLDALDLYAGDLLPEIGPGRVGGGRARAAAVGCGPGGRGGRPSGIRAGGVRGRHRRGPALPRPRPVPRPVLVAAGRGARAARRPQRGRGHPSRARPCHRRSDQSLDTALVAGAVGDVAKITLRSRLRRREVGSRYLWKTPGRVGH